MLTRVSLILNYKCVNHYALFLISIQATGGTSEIKFSPKRVQCHTGSKPGGVIS